MKIEVSEKTVRVIVCALEKRVEDLQERLYQAEGKLSLVARGEVVPDSLTTLEDIREERDACQRRVTTFQEALSVMVQYKED